jgi:hypothetical protein
MIVKCPRGTPLELKIFSDVLFSHHPEFRKHVNTAVVLRRAMARIDDYHDDASERWENSRNWAFPKWFDKVPWFYRVLWEVIMAACVTNDPPERQSCLALDGRPPRDLWMIHVVERFEVLYASFHSAYSQVHRDPNAPVRHWWTTPLYRPAPTLRTKLEALLASYVSRIPCTRFHIVQDYPYGSTSSNSIA